MTAYVASMTAQELREKFLVFFEKKGHKIIPSSSLIPPPDDTSVILTTAGMQQFKPYFAGTKDPMQDFGTTDLASIQKCFRTSDINEVGDQLHLTFFEMLGNFSIGGYDKQEAIEFAWEFLTSGEWLGLPKNRFFATVFAGDTEIPPDDQSEKVWQKIAPGIEIKKFDREENFWPKPIWVGTCGPSSEIHLKTEASQSIELWNLVFTQYYHHGEGKFKDLGKVNIDTGMGFERIAMVTQHKSSIFETDLFLPIIRIIEQTIHKQYGNSLTIDRKIRIIADHLRGAVFLAADQVKPDPKNTRGSIPRRLIAKAADELHILGNKESIDQSIRKIVRGIIENFKEPYPELVKKESQVLEWISTTGQITVDNTLKGLEQMRKQLELLKNKYPISLASTQAGSIIFNYQASFGTASTSGFELAKKLGMETDKVKDSFEKAFKEHQAVSGQKVNNT